MDLQRLIMASDYKLLDVLPALGWDTGHESLYFVKILSISSRFSILFAYSCS